MCREARSAAGTATRITSYTAKVTVDDRGRCIYAWGAIDTNNDDAWDKYIDVNNSTSSGAPALGKHCG